jgi:hypothetical protein
MAALLRTSDRVYTCSDGTLAVLVPEDVQQLDRLQGRLRAELVSVAGDASLQVDCARVAYPSSGGPAEVLLAKLRQRLDA